jgi:hypothetical protein
MPLSGIVGRNAVQERRQPLSAEFRAELVAAAPGRCSPQDIIYVCARRLPIATWPRCMSRPRAPRTRKVHDVLVNVCSNS